MLKHYLLITWRSLLKNKSYSAINIGGMAIGLASFLVILLFLNHELSYDKWHPDLKKVVKISLRTDEAYAEATPAPLANFLKEKLPEVDAATSIQPAGEIEILVAAGDKKIYQKGSVNADSTFFQVFPYEFLHGDPKTALNKPNAMVLSEGLSAKLFGTENPIGKTVKVFNAYDCEVTGVMQTPTTPSHINAQFVWRSPYEKQNLFWQNMSYQTYVRTTAEMPVAALEAKADKAYYEAQVKKDGLSFDAFRKQGHTAGLLADAVGQIHSFPKHGPTYFSTVLVLLLLAGLLLLSAASNFSNLSIAAAVGRAKEVGVRKVLGSSSRQLRWLLLSETVLQVLLSLLLAVVLVQFTLPVFNQTFALNLQLFDAGALSSIGWQMTLCLGVVLLLSGLYPAVYTSFFNPMNALKGTLSQNTKGLSFRNALIVVQFVVSAFFITGALVVGRQMQYMQSRDKGFSGSQVLRIEAVQKTRDKEFETVRSSLLRIPGVQTVSKATTVPGDPFIDTSLLDFRYNGKTVRMGSVKVSDEFFSTLNIRLVNGRLFNNGYADQNTRSAVVNETAARQLGAANPVGSVLSFPYCDSVPVNIIGVVKDIHVSGFETAVQPVVYTIGNKACLFQSGGALLVKLNGPHLQQTIGSVEAAWKGIEPDFPIRYSFLDENFQKLFRNHRHLQTLFWAFTAAAVFISIMGLIALTAYFLTRRTKEIGIRKVLGAGLLNLTALLSKDFIRLVLLAVVVSLPLTWWATQQWLQGFAYRVNSQWWLFALAALIVLGVTLLAIGLQILRAARANPVKSLRTE